MLTEQAYKEAVARAAKIVEALVDQLCDEDGEEMRVAFSRDVIEDVGRELKVGLFEEGG